MHPRDACTTLRCVIRSFKRLWDVYIVVILLPLDLTGLSTVQMRYWPSEWWLDIGEFFICIFMDEDEVEVHKNA